VLRNGRKPKTWSFFLDIVAVFFSPGGAQAWRLVVSVEVRMFISLNRFDALRVSVRSGCGLVLILTACIRLSGMETKICRSFFLTAQVLKFQDVLHGAVSGDL
jgi:hypothetical protein